MRILILWFAVFITVNTQTKKDSTLTQDSLKTVVPEDSLVAENIKIDTVESKYKSELQNVVKDSSKNNSTNSLPIISEETIDNNDIPIPSKVDKEAIDSIPNVEAYQQPLIKKPDLGSDINYSEFLVPNIKNKNIDKTNTPITNNNDIQTNETISDKLIENDVKDTTESALETVTQIIPDSEVKDKLSDIFSIGKIIWALLLFVISFYSIKLITKILDKFSEKSTRYRIALKGMIPIFRIIAWTIVISIVVAVIFAPPVESLVVLSGSLGIAIGLASQDIIKNIFGGITTLFDRPFQVGDKVEIGTYYGEVKNIGLRSTRIVTPDDSVVSIPNGDIMTKSVSNANSGEPNCQVVAEIYLPSHIDLEKAREIAIRSAQVSKYIYLNKPISVIFKNEIHYNKSIIKMRLKAYVLDIRYEFKFMSDMTETTIRELLKHGIISKKELNDLSA